MDPADKIILDYGLQVINNRRDVVRSWWVTITSLSGAILIGLSIAFISNKIPEESIENTYIFLAIFLPVMVILLLEFFLESLELNEKYERTIQVFLDKNIPNGPITITDVIKLQKLDVKNYIDIKGPTAYDNLKIKNYVKSTKYYKYPGYNFYYK